MPEFGPDWEWIKDLSEGGQAHTFLVKKKGSADEHTFVLKRLKNLKRSDRFEREVSVCQKLNHPNVLRTVSHGTDPKGRPFLVTEYCAGGALSDRPMPIGSTLPETLDIFRQICRGVAYAQEQGVVHRDIKPENIFFHDDETPVVGDFGICFVDDDERLTIIDEVMGARFYCAPELRDGRLESGIPPQVADVYSLGKLLYWMLSYGKIFDREDHRKDGYLLGRHDPGAPEYPLINQLLDLTIVADPHRRILGVPQLLGRVEGLIGVIRAGGHAITLKVPHRCLFCAQGAYKIVANGLQEGQHASPDHPELSNEEMSRLFGLKAPGHTMVWITMICEACGHIQMFRPDLAPNGMKNWKS